MPLITKPSQLNERVTFIGTAMDIDEYGNQVPTETEILTCWAQVRTDFMNKEFVARQEAFPDSIEIVIRYNQAADITKATKIRWHGNTLSIDKINRDTAYKQWTTVVATETVSEATANDINSSIK